MPKIISNGRAVQVSEAEIEELLARVGVYGWYRYRQLLFTMSHAEALATIR